MALRGAAISVGRQANTSSLRPFPRYLRSTHHHLRHVSATSNPAFLRSTNPLPSYGVMRFPIRAINGTAEGSSESWEIKMLYDGECPLCMKEVNMLRERNQRYRTIKFVDISSDGYNPEDNQGLDYKTVMGRIHAIQSDGTVVKDVEAFRRLYEVVGLGWVYAITKYEPIASIASAVYGIWAKYRLQITGRPPLEQVLEERRKKGEVCGDSKVCKM